MANKSSNSKTSRNYRQRAKSQAAKDNYQDAQADWDDAKRKSNRGRSGKEGVVAVRTGSKDNDPSWYTKNPTILRNVATVPFGYVLGVNNPNLKLEIDTANAIPQSMEIPGIFRMRWIPFAGPEVNYGRSQLGAAPINVAGEQAYSYLMKGKSVSKEFDPCDVTMYYLAMDSAFAYYAWLIRIYGVLTNYSPTNKYTPRLLVTAMGVNFDDVVSNLANFRLMINLYADRLSTMYVPKSVTYITRHIFMSESVYMDSNTTKPQLYLYNPAAFYIFDETTTPAKLTLQAPGGKNSGMIGHRDKLLTAKQLQTFANKILDPIIASQDLNIISAYVLNAYGAAGVMQVAPIAETFSVTPVYSQEVLTQFENAEAFSPSLFGDANVVYESTITPTTQIGASVIVNKSGLLQYSSDTAHQPIVKQLTSSQRLLNFHKDDVSPDDIMVATRMKTPMTDFTPNSEMKTFFSEGANRQMATVTSAPVQVIVPTHGGSELCFDFTLYEQGGSNTPQIFTFGSVEYYNLTNNYSGNYMLCKMHSWLAAFDWHPFVTVGWSTAGVNDGKVFAGTPVGDYDNFTLLSDDVLDNMHYYALLSEITSIS